MTRDPARAAWRTSSFSGNQGNCVEVAVPARPDRPVALRDSKDPHGAVLACTPAAWRSFTAAIRRGGYDLT
ncbi:MAG: DUF397 domain-containing protein [Carbonactinosporaceae bacterium]